MSLLSAVQIAQVAQAAGFSNSGQYQMALTWAVAIALAESSGQTDATNYNTNGSVDRGLWQINSIHCPPYQAASLFIASYNATAAFAISGNGTNFQPWTTFWSGAAAARWSAAAAGVAMMQNPGNHVNVNSSVLTGTFVPDGGGSLFYQTVVWRHEEPTLVLTPAASKRTRFH